MKVFIQLFILLLSCFQWCLCGFWSSNNQKQPRVDVDQERRKIELAGFERRAIDWQQNAIKYTGVENFQCLRYETYVVENGYLNPWLEMGLEPVFENHGFTAIKVCTKIHTGYQLLCKKWGIFTEQKLHNNRDSNRFVHMGVGEPMWFFVDFMDRLSGVRHYMRLKQCLQYYIPSDPSNISKDE